MRSGGEGYLLASKILLLVLLLIVGYGESRAQVVEQIIKSLQIGDTVPDVIFESKFKVMDINSGTKSISLKDHAGKKLILIDFWATWCAPCIASLPKMDSLQVKYAEDIAVIPITYETADKVKDFFGVRVKANVAHSNLNYITGNTIFSSLFKHSTLPHYVWLDGKGKVLAITDAKEVNSTNIEKVIRSEHIILPVKNDYRAPFDKAKPVFFDDEKMAGMDLIKQSSLTRYSNRFGCGYIQTVGLKDEHPKVKNSHFRRVFAYNLSMIQLYQLAHSDNGRYFNWHNTLVLTKDSLNLLSSKQGADYVAWLKSEKGFCYELVVSNEYKNKAWEIMQNDLKQHFPNYRAYTEKRKVQSYCLIRTSDSDKIRSKGGEKINTINLFGGRINQFPLTLLIRVLEDRVFINLNKPLINLTNYSGPVDITLNGNISDLTALNMALENYDLEIVEQDREVEMLIIEDENL